jgi:hypothetical protein
MNEISSVPMTYAGVHFRSTLEADWAATLDSLGIVWQYEPEAVRLPSGALYLPDFYLPEIATWLEVKGPHMQRLDKTKELARSVCHSPDCPPPAVCTGCELCIHGFGHEACCGLDYQLVVIGLAPVRGLLAWQVAGAEEGAMTKCSNCGAWWWYDSYGSFGCRKHRRHRGGDEDLGESGEELTFVRAPRVAA